MLEIQGNIWDFWTQETPIAITTNQQLNNKNELIMGKGLALEAKEKFPELPKQIAFTSKTGATFYRVVENNKGKYLAIIPTKLHWRDKSSIEFIEQQVKQLLKLENIAGEKFKNIYIPKLGCGNGGLQWEIVKKSLSQILDDRFIVVSQ